MAAGLGYIEFTTGDVLTAASANGYLASQVVMVFASAAARTSAIASPQEGMFSYLKDTNSTEYYSGSAWVAVGGGAAGGKVLQVVQAVYTTSTAIATDSYSDTGLSLSITPSASTSKVLVMVSQGVYVERSSSSCLNKLKIVRGSTTIHETDRAGGITANGTTYVALSANEVLIYLDSPATTSATTYKTQGAVVSATASAQAVFQENSRPSTITLMEIGA
jgi:hypothetical protein